MNNENLVGMKFGHLTVVGLRNRHSKGNSWLCHCECGNEIVLYTSHLLGSKKRRPNRSCGCMSEKQHRNTIEHPRIYGIWKDMIYRCYKPSKTGYERYGGKGITVCDEWINSFDHFLEWALQNGYSDSLTIDRIESTKPYGPSNCRWADYFTQNANKGIARNNKTGVIGVCKWHDKFRAYVTRMGKRKNLGMFSTLFEAEQARQNALRTYELTGTL